VEFIRFHRELRGAKTAVMTSCIYARTPQPPTPTFISQHIIAKLAYKLVPKTRYLACISISTCCAEKWWGKMCRSIYMELMREAKRRKKEHTSHINESTGNAVEEVSPLSGGRLLVRVL
jgi:hypothetical protein